jgi:hypothetical protein
MSSYNCAFGQLYRSLSFNFTPKVIEDSNTFDKLLKGSATIVVESGEAFPNLVWSSQANILKDLLPDSACALFPSSTHKGRSLDFSAAWGVLVSLLEAGFLQVMLPLLAQISPSNGPLVLWLSDPGALLVPCPLVRLP